MKEIKTKPAIKDIKMQDKTKVVSRKLKNSYIRAKKQTEQTEYNDDKNYVDDAGNSMRVGTEAVVLKAIYAMENYGKMAIIKVKESIKRSIFQHGARKSAKENVPFQSDIKTEMQSPKAFSKFVCNIKLSETNNKAIRNAAKGNIKRVQKSIKSVDYTAKSTIKVSQTAVKAVSKATLKSPQSTKRAVLATRMTARMTAASVKMASKAIVATLKATIATIKSLTTLIISGGFISVVIIMVICLIGFLTGSVYGIFLSNESFSPNAPIMKEVISQLNKEFTAEIKKIQDDNPHDTLDLSGNMSGIVNNWPEILTVYAVKVSTNLENGMEVAILDDTKVGILRRIFWDMNQIKYSLEIIENKETTATTNKNGTEKVIPKTILHIDVTSKSYLSVIEQYGFNTQQVKMLNELMKDDNRQLFMQLIGG